MFIVLVWISYKHVSANSSHCSESWNKVVHSWVSQMSCWCFSSSNRFVSSGLFVPPCLSTPTLNCVFSKFWPLGFNPHLVLEPSSCNRSWLACSWHQHSATIHEFLDGTTGQEWLDSSRFEVEILKACAILLECCGRSDYMRSIYHLWALCSNAMFLFE